VPLSQIAVTFSEEPNPIDARATANYELRRAVNGVFDDSDDVVYKLTPQYTLGSDLVQLYIAGGPLPAGTYRLIVRGTTSIHDLAGLKLDGDGNGAAGGDYVRTFVVTSFDSTRTWDGGGADDKWSTGADWVGDVMPQPGEHLVFAGTVRPTPLNDFAANTVFRALTFTHDGFTLSGQPIVLDPNGGTAVGNDFASAGTNTVQLPITLASAGMVTVAAGLSRLEFGSTATINTAGHLLTLDDNSSGEGSRFRGAISGAGAVMKTGAGIATLEGSNSYTGGTTVLGGTLYVSNADALPLGGSLIIGAGGTVVLASGLSAGGSGTAASTSPVARSLAATVPAANSASDEQAIDAEVPAAIPHRPTLQATPYQHHALTAATTRSQPAHGPVTTSTVQVAAEHGTAAVSQPSLGTLAARTASSAARPVPAPPIQARHHDQVLQSAALQSRTDLDWAWALEGVGGRKQSPKKNAHALFAVDQVLADWPR
jgi:autotransporter-associated beta strand protein